jgi:flagellar hook-basal body complex protein FliE
MNIEPILAVSANLETPQVASSELRAPIDFGALVGEPLDALNTALQQADASTTAFALGDDVPVHEVMIHLEEARLAMQLAVEVRNRAVEAYQELMRMQL